MNCLGKPAAMHSWSDPVVSVMGVDVTLGYLYKLLVDILPVCTSTNITCFLFEEGGYILAHPHLLTAARRTFIIRQHLTHMQPLVANDILNHHGFVKKSRCNSYSDRTTQR